jgi:hypothetical protein
MNIRELKTEDIQQCVEIFKLNAPDEGWEHYPVEKLIFELNGMFANNGFITPKYFVCEIEDKIVGFAGHGNCGFDDGVFGLFWANVHPSYRNKGVGKLLTEVRLTDIKKENGEMVLSTTRKEWHLKRFGFENIGTRGDGYFLMQLIIKN